MHGNTTMMPSSLYLFGLHLNVYWLLGGFLAASILSRSLVFFWVMWRRKD